MKVDLVPELIPSGVYGNIVTATDVFSGYLFAYPTESQDYVARVIFGMMPTHAHLPATITFDKGSTSVFQLIKEVANVLGINVEHATTKHNQAIGMFERLRVSIKGTPKIEKGKRRPIWH